MLNLATLTESVYIKCTIQEYPSIAPLLHQHGYSWLYDIAATNNCLTPTTTHIKLLPNSNGSKRIVATDFPIVSNLPRYTLQDLLNPPLPLEEVLVMFLKSQRAFSAWKKSVTLAGTSTLYTSIASTFIWENSPSGKSAKFWGSLDDKLKNLCKHFKLEGDNCIVDISKCLKMR
jgi:hypothetical protein